MDTAEAAAVGPSRGDEARRRAQWRDFRLLWAGQSASLVGDHLMVLALPLLAVERLGRSAAEAALLPFALFVPFLFLGLPAGAIVDRARRRSVLLACDAVQLAVFLAVAALAAAGALPLWLLLILVAVAGSAAVFFQVAYTSYLPAIVSGDGALHRGNSRLFFSESVARTLGPMAGGPVIAVFGPVAALATNASTFAASILAVLGIRTREPAPAALARRGRGWMRREIGDGLRFALGHRLIEPVLTCGAVYVLFLSMVEAILVLYSRDVLGLSALGIGVVVGGSAAGLPVGNLLSQPIHRRLGAPRTLVAGASVSVLGVVAMAIAGNVYGSAGGLVAASVLHGIGEGTFGPTSLTLRQTQTPSALLGRVNAVQRFLLWGAVPIGSLAAAGATALGGLAATMWVGALGTTLCLPPLLRRGIWADVVAGGLRHVASPGADGSPAAQGT